MLVITDELDLPLARFREIGDIGEDSQLRFASKLGCRGEAAFHEATVPVTV